MFRKKKSHRNSNRRSKFSLQGRSLQFEAMEGRLVLSASGFGGNECAPELNDVALDAIVPTQAVSAQTEIAFQFSAANVVSDAGEGATAASDIRFILDPDLGTRTNGATPDGATLSLNDQGTTSVADDTWDFSWTPTASQLGTFRLFLIATDDGGTGNAVPLSDVYAFEISVDNKPSVDLNGSDEDGTNAGAVSFTESDNSVPVSIVDSDLFIFSGNGQVESVTVQITDVQADGLETLAVTAGSSLVVDDSTPGQLVISVVGGGTADKSVFEDALRTLTYNNTSQDPALTRTINVTVNDGTATSAISTATVNITPTNNRPDLQLAASLPDGKVGEEYVIDLVATDPDRSTDLLVFRITSGPAGAVISPNGLSDDSSDNTIQVAPDADGLYKAQIRWTPTVGEVNGGSALFTVVVTDSGGLADAKLYEIGITNQAPVANDDPTSGADSFKVSEDDTSTVIGDILDNDTDADGDSLTVHAAFSGDTPLTLDSSFIHPVSGARITISSGGQITYNPNGQFESLGAGDTATDTFQYTMVDAHGNESGLATVTVTINGANDAPTAVAGVVPEFRVSESAGATTLDLSTLLLTAVTDVDTNDVLMIASAPSNPAAGGLFALNGGTLSFDPNGDFDVDNGAAETIDFFVSVKDTAGHQVAIPARLLIEGVNIAPVAVNDPGYSTDEDSVFTLTERNLGVLENDTDESGNAALSVAEVNGESANVGNALTILDSRGRTGQLTVNADGTFIFDSHGNFTSLVAGTSSQVTFTYRSSDGATQNALSNEATVTITVNGVNDVPVANAVTAAVTDGATGTESFSGLDADDDETATLDYAITSTPSEGSVVNNNDGTFTFDPGDDFHDLAVGITRDVTFDYTATDAQSAVSDAAIATVTVTGVNDAPVFDLNNTDGLASTLPTGSLQSANVVAVELDLSSSDANVNSLNSIDIPSFASDVDGDTIGFSLASGDNGGTAFRSANRPTLNASNQLAWTPTTADVGTGYIIRVTAQDQPGQDPLTASFDLLVSVVTANSPQLASVSELDTSLDTSVVALTFDEPMGSTAFVAGNYTLEVIDGTLATTAVPVASATVLTGDRSVELTLDDTLLNSIAAAGGTKLKLTLNSQITDADGNVLDGALEHEISLNMNAAT